MKSTVVALSIICFLVAFGGPIAVADGPPIRILATGAEYNGFVTCRFSPSGDFYAMEAFRGEMYRMDPNTGEVLEVITEAMGSTADFVFSSDGTMYWINAFVGEVYKREPGEAPVLLAALGSAIDGLAMNGEERLFTASFSATQMTWEIDTEGINPPVVVAELGGYDAFDFGPDGFLYGPDFQGGTGNIFKVDISTGTWEIFAGGFVNPTSIRFSPDEELHVLDSGAAQVVKVDLISAEKTLVAEIAPVADSFCFSPEGEIYIAFIGDAFIGKVGADGQVEALTRPGMSSPGGISVRPGDHGPTTLYVADAFSLRQLHASSGRLMRTIRPGPVIPPFSLADDGTYLIVSNTMFNQVQVVNPDTFETAEFYGDFAVPMNAIRFQGTLAVAELGTGSVVRSTDRVPYISGLTAPVGLAGDNDSLYVGDFATGNIYKAVEAGQVLAEGLLLASELSEPEGMAIDLDGTLLVVETGAQRLVRIDPVSLEVTVVADNLSAIGLAATAGLAPPGLAVSGVAVAQNGDIFLPGDLGNVIYKIPSGKRDRIELPLAQPD